MLLLFLLSDMGTWGLCNKLWEIVPVRPQLTSLGSGFLPSPSLPDICIIWGSPIDSVVSKRGLAPLPLSCEHWVMGSVWHSWSSLQEPLRAATHGCWPCVGSALSGHNLQVGTGGKWKNTRTTSSPLARNYVL